MYTELTHGTTFISYSRFAVAANLRGRGLSQSSCSCYLETAPFQDGKQSQMHSYGFSSAIATTETSPGFGGLRNWSLSGVGRRTTSSDTPLDTY